MTERLMDDMTGRWRVRTASGSTYVVDLDVRTVRRRMPDPPQGSEWESGPLRRDGEPVVLAAVGRVELGEPAHLLLRGVANDAAVVTSRVTAPVVAIEPDDGDDGEWSEPTRHEFVSGMTSPERCYAAGCDAENEILVHLAPGGFADLCLEHARTLVERSGFVLTCDCPFCRRARVTLLGLPT